MRPQDRKLDDHSNCPSNAAGRPHEPRRALGRLARYERSSPRAHDQARGGFCGRGIGQRDLSRGCRCRGGDDCRAGAHPASLSQPVRRSHRDGGDDDLPPSWRDRARLGTIGGPSVAGEVSLSIGVRDGDVSGSCADDLRPICALARSAQHRAPAMPRGVMPQVVGVLSTRRAPIWPSERRRIRPLRTEASGSAGPHLVIVLAIHRAAESLCKRRTWGLSSSGWCQPRRAPHSF